MRELVKTSRAELDLASIWADLSVFGDDVAERAISQIERRCEVLQRFPFGGEACPMFGKKTHWFPAGNNYVIFYRPEADRIQVVRVLDGRRDLRRAFWQY